MGTSLMDKIKPKDIIAVIVLVFLFVLLLKGYNGWVQATMSVILAYYFVKRSNGADSGT